MLRITYDGGKVLDGTLPQARGLMNWYLQNYLMNWRAQLRLSSEGKGVVYGTPALIAFLVVACASTKFNGLYLTLIYLVSYFVGVQIMLFRYNLRACECLRLTDFLPEIKEQLEDNIVDVPREAKIDLLSYFYGEVPGSRTPFIGAVRKNDDLLIIKKDGSAESSRFTTATQEEWRYLLKEMPNGKAYSIVDLIYNKAKK